MRGDVGNGSNTIKDESFNPGPKMSIQGGCGNHMLAKLAGIRFSLEGRYESLGNNNRK